MNVNPFPILRLWVVIAILLLAGCSTPVNGLPARLGDLNLTKVLKDREATAIIQQMHGKALGPTHNLIAYYGNARARNILYLSVYPDAQKAREDLMAMAVKMASGTAVFAPLTSSPMGSQTHFQTQGMGLQHYFYRLDNILIWWQVDPEKAESTYRDLVRFDFALLNVQSPAAGRKVEQN